MVYSSALHLNSALGFSFLFFFFLFFSFLFFAWDDVLYDVDVAFGVRSVHGVSEVAVFRIHIPLLLYEAYSLSSNTVLVLNLNMLPELDKCIYY